MALKLFVCSVGSLPIQLFFSPNYVGPLRPMTVLRPFDRRVPSTTPLLTSLSLSLFLLTCLSFISPELRPKKSCSESYQKSLACLSSATRSRCSGQGRIFTPIIGYVRERENFRERKLPTLSTALGRRRERKKKPNHDDVFSYAQEEPTRSEQTPDVLFRIPLFLPSHVHHHQRAYERRLWQEEAISRGV